MNKTFQNTIKRCSQNPLLTSADVLPSREDFIVEGIFNCGVTTYQNETILLCRIAESAYTENPDCLRIPIIKDSNGSATFDVVDIRKKDHPELCFDDSRTVTRGGDANKGIVCLTTLSHLRLARSKDGIHFTVDPKPSIMPNSAEECWGMEDPRITKIHDTYYINYTAAAPIGATVALISTKDFQTFERHGIIFMPENKDVAIFPEKIGGKYWAFSRPVPNGIGTPDMWLSQSEDLLHWGAHRYFFGVSADGWENGRIGGGAPPFKTEKGWVKIYHAADKNNRYALGVFLLDENNPMRILAKSREPLMYPQTSYEEEGFFGGVVFTCGCLFDGSTVKIYYGAADDKIGRADIGLDELYQHLEV